MTHLEIWGGTDRPRTLTEKDVQVVADAIEDWIDGTSEPIEGAALIMRALPVDDDWLYEAGVRVDVPLGAGARRELAVLRDVVELELVRLEAVALAEEDGEERQWTMPHNLATIRPDQLALTFTALQNGEPWMGIVRTLERDA